MDGRTARGGATGPRRAGAARLAILGCRGIPARYGGFETFAEELGARLVARGHSVTVYCEREGPGPPPSEHRGVRLVHLAVPRLGPATTLLPLSLVLKEMYLPSAAYEGSPAEPVGDPRRVLPFQGVEGLGSRNGCHSR